MEAGSKRGKQTAHAIIKRNGETTSETWRKKKDSGIPGVNGEVKLISSRPRGHQYPSHIMLLGIEQVIHGLSSLRGSERTFSIFSKCFDLPVPSFNSVRSWIFRVGLYLIKRQQEWRNDWIFIVDHTLKLGQNKCLLILGIKGEQLKKGKYALEHQSVTVLGMDVVTSSTGELVKEQLEEVSRKVGVPKQIVTDHGPDIKKGVELYKQKHPDVIYTYDVTHKMAALLKKELQADEQWLNFLKQCGKVRTSLKQTNLHYLLPPRQRTKARYSDVTPQIEWGQKMIAYQQMGDYSEIDRTFTLDQQTIEAVKDKYGHSVGLPLTATEQETFVDQDAFTQNLVSLIGDEQVERIESVIYPAADEGRRRFEQKLGWVAEYEKDLVVYAQMTKLVTIVEKQVKNNGLNQTSCQTFENNIADISLSSRSQLLAREISNYLQEEGQQIHTGLTLLGTSDIIESIFGKYKHLSSESPISDVGKMILTIPVFTNELTCELIKTAMESVKALDVDKWADELLGKSSFSKQRMLSRTLKTT